MICKLSSTNWDQIKRIYVAGIETGNASFEQSKNIKSFDNWIEKKIQSSCIGYLEGNEVLGWAGLSSVSTRCVYAGVAEVSVYVDLSQSGKGVGSTLMKALIEFAEANKIWTLQAGIFPENKASLFLHEKFGFRLVGRREKIGKLNGVWRDTLLYERRSNTIL